METFYDDDDEDDYDDDTDDDDDYQICRRGLEKDCDIEGDEICSTQYESECTTSQERHEVF